MSAPNIPLEFEKSWVQLLNAIDGNHLAKLDLAILQLKDLPSPAWADFAMNRVMQKDSVRLAKRLIAGCPSLLSDKDIIEKAALSSAWKILEVLLDANCQPPTKPPALGFTMMHGGMRKTWGETVCDAMGQGVWPHLDRWCPRFLENEEIAERVSSLLIVGGSKIPKVFLSPEFLAKITTLHLPHQWAELISDDLGSIVRSDWSMKRFMALPDPAQIVCQMMEYGWINMDVLERSLNISKNTNAPKLREVIARAQALALSRQTPLPQSSITKPRL